MTNAVVVEVKKTPFHINGNQTVAQKAIQILGTELGRLNEQNLEIYKTRLEPLVKGQFTSYPLLIFH